MTDQSEPVSDMVLVPRQPTESMVLAGSRTFGVRNRWSAMLAVAPTAHRTSESDEAKAKDWMPAETAPKDGTLLELKVDYTNGHSPLHDAIIAPTIGWNEFADTGEDKWHIVGWDWCQDHIRDGDGLIVGWRPSRLNACDDALRPTLAFAASEPAVGSAEEVDKPVLVSREIDDDCGCPEEVWEAYGAHLHMHLSAGKESNAHADYGDEGEFEMSVTTPTIGEAPAAIFGWVQHLFSPLAQENTEDQSNG